jgi:hypothetical protein
MSGIFGGGGGSKGSPENVNIPPFESQGGITPQQQDLAQYTYGENLLGQGSMFGSSGTGDSTMATQGAEGARNTMAQQQGQMSDIDQEAQYQLYQNDVQSQIQQLQNAQTLDQSASPNLSSLASSAGSLFGQSGGSFGATT